MGAWERIALVWGVTVGISQPGIRRPRITRPGISRAGISRPAIFFQVFYFSLLDHVGLAMSPCSRRTCVRHSRRIRAKTLSTHLGSQICLAFHNMHDLSDVTIHNISATTPYPLRWWDGIAVSLKNRSFA